MRETRRQHPFPVTEAAGIHGELGGVPQTPLRQLLWGVGGESFRRVAHVGTDRLGADSRREVDGFGGDPTGVDYDILRLLMAFDEIFDSHGQKMSKAQGITAISCHFTQVFD